jgi:hypothetical protein
VLPAFDTLPAVALPALDILPTPVLFIMLPEEVMLLDFTAELPFAFPVEEVAPSTEEAEPALASIMAIENARTIPKMLDNIFVIDYREHADVLILSSLKYETGIQILSFLLNTQLRRKFKV